METWNVEDDTTALEHENGRAEKEKKRGTRGEKSGKGKREEVDEERGREWTVDECVGWEEIEKMVKKHTAGRELGHFIAGVRIVGNDQPEV